MSKSARLPQEAINQSTMLEREARDYFEQAAQQTENELARLTFEAVAERHAERADQVEAAYRAVARGEAIDVGQSAAPRSMFDAIMRSVEDSGAPTPPVIANLREALVYSAKLRDVYRYLTSTAAQDWEQRFFELLDADEVSLRMTLSDTLNYLSSNIELSALPKES